MMKTLTRLALVTAAVTLTACQSQRKIVESNSISDTPQSANATQSHRTATLWVKGLACPFCIHNVERHLLKVPGVERVDTDLSSGRVQVSLAQGQHPSEQQLKAAIDNSGFTLDRIELP